MAREESEREDLMAEAVALVNRGLFEVEFLTDPVVVGFRKDGAPSFYFGQDEVYQFNQDLEFRRGHLIDQLIKVESGKLIRTIRKRSAQEVHLVSTPFSQSDTDRYLAGLRQRLTQLNTELISGLQPKEQVSFLKTNFADRVLRLTDDLLANDFVIARSPGINR